MKHGKYNLSIFSDLQEAYYFVRILIFMGSIQIVGLIPNARWLARKWRPSQPAQPAGERSTIRPSIQADALQGTYLPQPSKIF